MDKVLMSYFFSFSRYQTKKDGKRWEDGNTEMKE